MKTRQHHLSVCVDVGFAHIGLRDLRFAADCDDATFDHSKRLRPGLRRVHRVDDGVVQDDVGRLASRCTGDAQNRQECRKGKPHARLFEFV